MPDRFEERITQLRELGCAVTDEAAETAHAIIGQLPHLTLGVFPLTGDSGGIQLQAVTATSTVLACISAEGSPVTGEYADLHHFYERQLWDQSEVVRWFKQFAPEEVNHA